MRIEYLVYDTRLHKPESLHDSKRKAKEHVKTLYGSSSYVILQIVIATGFV